MACGKPMRAYIICKNIWSLKYIAHAEFAASTMTCVSPLSQFNGCVEPSIGADAVRGLSGLSRIIYEYVQYIYDIPLNCSALQIDARIAYFHQFNQNPWKWIRARCVDIFVRDIISPTYSWCADFMAIDMEQRTWKLKQNPTLLII